MKDRERVLNQKDVWDALGFLTVMINGSNLKTL